MPAAKREGYHYAVTILDRWENEYAPVTPGAVATQAPEPVLLYPEDGAEVPELSSLQWQGESSLYVVQVFADSEMDSLVSQVEVDSMSCPLPYIPCLTAGTYWWRVVARGLNQWDNASALRQFTIGQMCVTSPASDATSVPLKPLIMWTPGAQGTTYRLELSSSRTMSNADTVVLHEPQWQVPQYRLSGATTYYVRVTATYGSATVTTPVSPFTTVEVIPPVPAYLRPADDDTILYNIDKVAFEPIEGTASLKVQISNSETFPTRTSYNGTLEGTFETPLLGDIKGAGKLVDGGTYYVRARYGYRTLATGTTIQYTDYCPVRSFVYHEMTPGDVNSDLAITIDDVTMLIDYLMDSNIQGVNAINADANSDGIVDIEDLSTLIDMLLRRY